MATVREIAAYAGVSKSTVSLVLNNKSGVSEAMRQRVFDAVEALNEGQSRAQPLPPLHSQKALSILVLHPPTLDDEVFTEYLQGIWAEAARHNLHLRLAANEPNLPGNHITNLVFSDPSLRPDGVIILGAKSKEPLMAKTTALGLPCVSVHREKSHPGISTVGVDEAAIAAEATQHLLELGHRAIAFMGGDPGYDYVHGRLRGYRLALAGQGTEIPANWIWLGFNQGDMEALLSQSPEVTALVCMNDTYALDYAIPALQARGCKIPDDFSIVGFDNLQAARIFDPPLTSVSYPRYQESVRAVEVLVERIDNPMLASQHIVFRAKLHKRASSAPPRGPWVSGHKADDDEFTSARNQESKKIFPHS